MASVFLGRMLTLFYFISYHLGVIMVELLQIRGSIPLLWQQIVDLTYKPKFELLKLEDAVSVCLLLQLCGFYMFYMYFTFISLLEMQPRVLERHILDLRKKYGAVLAVDLVNKVNMLSYCNKLRMLVYWLTTLPNDTTSLCNCIVNFIDNC